MQLNNLKFFLGASILAFFASIFLLSCIGCGGSINHTNKKGNLANKHDSKRKIQSIKNETISKEFSSEQLSIIKKSAFDKKVESFDTESNFQKDSLPFRLLPLENRIRRMDKSIKVLGITMNRSNEGYISKNSQQVTKMSYPGVLAQYNPSWGDYATKVVLLNQKNGKHITLDLNKITPYSLAKYKSIKPGMFDFERMVIDKSDVNNNFKEEASGFLENRNLKLQKTTKWFAINFQLLALNNDKVIGFESTIIVYNQQGDEIYKKILPYGTQYEFISTDNRYLVYAPLTAEYMINAINVQEQLVIVDLVSKKEIHKTIFTDQKMRFTALKESRGDNILNVKYKIYSPKKEKEDFIYRYYDLSQRFYLELKKTEIDKNDINPKVPYLEQLPYDITKY